MASWNVKVLGGWGGNSGRCGSGMEKCVVVIICEKEFLVREIDDDLVVAGLWR